MCNMVFRCKEKKYGIIIPIDLLSQITRYCIESGRIETGGLLAGFYSENHFWANITDVLGAPEDSKRGSTYFNRGTKGVQVWIDSLWEKNRYYIGEWHYHPNVYPVPSPKDKNQIRAFSRKASLHCPEPILFIVGGNVNKAPIYTSYVFSADKGLLLMEANEKT